MREERGGEAAERIPWVLSLDPPGGDTVAAGA